MHFIAPGRANLRFHLRVEHSASRAKVDIRTEAELEELHKRYHEDDEADGMAIPPTDVSSGSPGSTGFC